MLCDTSNITIWDDLKFVGLRTESEPLVSVQKTGEVVAPPGMDSSFRYYSSTKLRAVLVVENDIRFYPRDVLYVPITLEALHENTSLKLLLPRENAVLMPDFTTDEAIQIDDGRTIVAVEAITYDFRYSASDPGTYDRAMVIYAFDRNDITNWVQALSPTLLAFIVSVGSCFLTAAHSFDARLGVLGATLFVVVINVNTFNQFLYFPPSRTTGDYVNLVTIIMIAFLFLEAILERWLYVRYEEAQRLMEETEEDDDRRLEAEEIATAIEKRQIIMRRRTDLEADELDVKVDMDSVGLHQRALKEISLASEARPASPKPSSTRSIKSFKTRCCQLFPDPKAKTDTERGKLTEYEQFIINMSYGTFAVTSAVYIAVVIGLLVGYRPSTCFKDFVC